MSANDTSIQQSALVSPLHGLSSPAVDIVGQVGISVNSTIPATYKPLVDPSSGPFLADSAANIQLFTDIFNSGETLENTIDGVVHNNDVDIFHGAIIATGISSDITIFSASSSIINRI